MTCLFRFSCVSSKLRAISIYMHKENKWRTNENNAAQFLTPTATTYVRNKW